MIPLLAVLARADPGACVPDRDVSGSAAVGFCLSPDEYSELGRLRSQVQDLTGRVAARDDEIQVFDTWEVAHDADLRTAIQDATEAATTALVQAERRYTGELSAARRRSALERHGFAIGMVVGVAATVGTTALVLQTYGTILGPGG